MDEIMEENKWWLIIDYDTTKRIIRADLANMQRSFIDIGCQLMQVRDRELYKDGGYENVWAFAEQEFGIQRSTASRWMKMCQKFSVDGSSPVLKDEYKDFGKSQLQEMLYLEDEQLEEVTPGMTVKEIRELRAPKEVEEEPLSILGHPLRIYPEGSLITTPGCGKQDCFSCHRGGCELRQVDCYCVEAPMGNPFPCNTLNVVESIRQDIGSKCQFVNEDLAFHRAGDGQPVPCCKKCDNPCGYECNRSVRSRHEAAKKNMCDVAHESEEQITGQMSVEDYPELLPDQKESDSDIDNNEYNVVIEQPEIVINQPESVIETEENVIDTDYQEMPEDQPKRSDTMLTYLVKAYIEEFEPGDLFKESCDMDIFCEDARFELFGFSIRFHYGSDELRAEFNDEINITNAETYEEIGARYTWDQFFEELDRVGDIGEQYAAENTETDEICCQESADLDKLTFSQIAIRDYLKEEERTLAEYEKVNSEDGGLPYNLMMRQRMLVKALRLLLESEAELEEDDELEEQEEPSPVQSDLPVMRNNDQRKEWLKNYKDWPVWFEVPEASEIYYRFNLPDGSSIVICEYHMWLSWKEKYSDENPDLIGTRKYLLNPGYRYLQDCCTNSTVLVEHLKNLQKGEKK